MVNQLFIINFKLVEVKILLVYQPCTFITDI